MGSTGLSQRNLGKLVGVLDRVLRYITKPKLTHKMYKYLICNITKHLQSKIIFMKGKEDFQ